MLIGDKYSLLYYFVECRGFMLYNENKKVGSKESEAYDQQKKSYR
ncbi:hypothetical protein L21TH_1033 [Caldisalinibacter kiritimatiensis]|uniref:Uncharacterized protein n=1 Tax=Caldisalinibacter kiritimatiensis TaxID=1304284 RepID=R1CF52_9FIRM|nr:hypothetical protein L21TH_1033 [Caldisalinibacter kiritimatiensis]